MSSQARIDASRANGRKSRGPITPEGKAISSQNAIRHGLTASTTLIDGELPERYEMLLASNIAEHQPVTPAEMFLVEKMTTAMWRQLRIWGFENVALNEEIQRQGAASEEMAQKDPAQRAYYAFNELANVNNTMSMFCRHDIRFDRAYTRALKALTDARSKKQ